MPKGKSKKSTPAELDKYFSRGVIEEKKYGEFWGRWDKADDEEREEIIRELEGTIDFIDGGVIEEITPQVTKSKAKAEREAKSIGGYVARRNKRGQFSKRGKFYQAMKRRKKK